jgi:hypothetical protein
MVKQQCLKVSHFSPKVSQHPFALRKVMDPYPPRSNFVQHRDNDSQTSWYSPELQTNNMIAGLDTSHYIPTQVNDATAHPFENIAATLTLAPHTMTSTSPYTLPDQPFDAILSSSHDTLVGPHTYGPPGVSGNPPHRPPLEPDLPMLPLAPTSTSIHIPTPIIPSSMAPSTSRAQTPKFACGVCPKTLSSRSRADTCLFNHMGIKPFTCKGACGIVGW